MIKVCGKNPNLLSLLDKINGNKLCRKFRILLSGLSKVARAFVMEEKVITNLLDMILWSMQILILGLFKLICHQVWSIPLLLLKNLLKWFFRILEKLSLLIKKLNKLEVLNAFIKEIKIWKIFQNTKSFDKGKNKPSNFFMLVVQ